VNDPSVDAERTGGHGLSVGKLKNG